MVVEVGVGVRIMVVGNKVVAVVAVEDLVIQSGERILAVASTIWILL